MTDFPEDEEKTKEQLIEELHGLRLAIGALANEYAITHIMSETPSFTAAIPQILQVLCINLGWEMGLFWKIDPRFQALRCLGRWVHPEVENRLRFHPSKPLLLSRGAKLAGHVWEKGKAEWVKNLSEFPDYLPENSMPEDGLQSALGIPISFGKEILGVMELFSKRKSGPDSHLLSVFTAIASQIAQFVERKEAEEALRSSQQRLQMSLEAAHMGYWSWEVEKDRIQWSEQLASLFGYCLKKPPSTETIEEFLSCIHREDRDRVREEMDRAVREMNGFNMEFRVVWKNETVHWISSCGHVYKNEEGELVLIGIGMDIDERHHSEEKLKEANEELERRVEKRTRMLKTTNERLQKEIVERKKVEKNVLEISQKEQRRIGMQIHDGLCQQMAGITMIAKVLGQKMEEKSLPEAKEVKKFSELMNECLVQAREMARGLYPVELEAESLMVSLKELTQKTQALTGVSCRFECPTPILITDNNVATHLYRIAQEAVNNAVRHGQAKNVEVELIQGESRITLIVRDDGKGISSEKKKTRGIGMHIMRYRARMIEGDLEFSDNGERGTRLVCTLPIPKEEN